MTRTTIGVAALLMVVAIVAVPAATAHNTMGISAHSDGDACNESTAGQEYGLDYSSKDRDELNIHWCADGGTDLIDTLLPQS